MRPGWSVPVGAFALLGGSVLAASMAAGASAATGHFAAARHSARPVVVRPGGLIRHLAGSAGVRHATSANWSGYALHGGKYRSVSASWTEPTGHCKAGGGHDYSSFWVGLDGYNTSTVEQTGTDTDCQGATPRYYAWYEMYPATSHRISHTVRPGDKLTASTTWNGGSSFTLKLTDHTRHWTAKEHRKLASAKRGSAEIIIEAPSSLTGELPLADFGTAHFTGARVDGAKIGGHHATKITMVDSGRHLDRVSGLSGGTNFSATWLRR
jgi:hypothetical protein